MYFLLGNGFFFSRPSEYTQDPRREESTGYHILDLSILFPSWMTDLSLEIN